MPGFCGLALWHDSLAGCGHPCAGTRPGGRYIANSGGVGKLGSYCCLQVGMGGVSAVKISDGRG